ncbi:hypothetical protein [Mesorhizobium retamae]|uniref:Uncharacterized protein n=1 Tax=Mesorhizobium retamae TaxID=2912854 RepID=A0ABS9QP19_9HYPH|nr:hypothetical protein [Mesorhizobium sp. IRAMC:0171]MCG7509199.1 hypothetical protein [Mesorhizobium sp. IRAMC:0171]
MGDAVGNVRAGALVIAVLGLIGPASSAEWWHDSFIWEDSVQACGDNDSIATYSDKTVELWEDGCTISKKTPISGLDAVILDLHCQGPEGDPPWKIRKMLFKLPNDKAAEFPPFQMLKRCSSLKDAPPKATQCDFNSQIFQATDDQKPGTYQELQFLEGIENGAVTLTEFAEGKPRWVSRGEHTCSNGASICRVSFSLMSGRHVILPYEIVDSSVLVIPSLRQDVYQSERGAVMQGKNYGGLVADLLGGFAPKEDELILPYNVYRYSECRPQPQ